MTGLIDPRPCCVNCGRRWVPDEGVDATVVGCIDCPGGMSDEALREEVECMRVGFNTQALGKAIARLTRERDSAREAVRELTRERDEARAALAKIDTIRDDIIGRQSINWSAHIYPLVKALGEAGYEGAGYDVAHKRVCQADDAIRELVEALRPFTREGSTSFARFDWDDIVRARALVGKYSR